MLFYAARIRTYAARGSAAFKCFGNRLNPSFKPYISGVYADFVNALLDSAYCEFIIEMNVGYKRNVYAAFYFF